MPEKPYDHNQIELKWHARWRDATFYKAEENSSRPKYYVLEILPYPSGTLHIGHIRNYAIGDALARKTGQFTRKLACVTTVPPGVVMVSGPVVAPAGTVAQI